MLQTIVFKMARRDKQKRYGGQKKAVFSQPRRLATVKEACAYAKMGRTKLYENINAKAIIAYKRGRKTLIDLDSIDVMNDRELKPWKSGK